MRLKFKSKLLKLNCTELFQLEITEIMYLVDGLHVPYLVRRLLVYFNFRFSTVHVTKCYCHFVNKYIVCSGCALICLGHVLKLVYSFLVVNSPLKQEIYLE